MTRNIGAATIALLLTLGLAYILHRLKITGYYAGYAAGAFMMIVYYSINKS